MGFKMRFGGIPLYIWIPILTIPIVYLAISVGWKLGVERSARKWNVNESEYIAIPAPAEVTPLEILQYIDIHEDEGRTWFSVHPGRDASEKYHILIRPFFVVETRLEGADKPVRLLRVPERIVRIHPHPDVVVGSQPVPYRKKDLWKITADVLIDKDQRYEFVQPGWEDFDPAKDLN